MEVVEWIDRMSRSGMVCPEYMRKIAAAEREADIFRVLCDANGGRWLFETHAKKVPMPVGGFCKEFSAYLDGKRVMEYPQGYTSKFYCRATEPDIDADTTLVYLMECMDMEVYVPRNMYTSVIMSDGTRCDLVLGEGSRANVELYGESSVNIVGDASKVRVTRH